MKNLRIAICAVLGAALVVALGTAIAPAQAEAKQPKLRTGFVKHDAWETLQTYKDTWEPNWTDVDYARTKLIRRGRRTIDVRFKIMFSKDWSGCMEAIGRYPDGSYWGPGGTNPATEECPAGSAWSEEWEGEVHTWTMRYQVRGHRISKWFRGDRHANLDPSSRKFGGLALSERDVSGVYDQSQWDYPLHQREPYPSDSYETDSGEE
jgi:hypothetical protein